MRFPARGLIRACLVCAFGLSFVSLSEGLADDGDDIRRDLKQALSGRDVESVDKAAAALAQSGGKKAMRVLIDFIDKIPPTDDALYWSVISGAVSFRDRPALEELGDYVKKNKAKPAGRDIVYALAKNGSPHAVQAVKGVVFDAPPEIRLMAATKVSRVKTKESVDILIELLKTEEKGKPEKPTELAWVAVEGLKAITRQNFGPLSVNWEGWWKVNREKPLPTGTEPETAGRTAVDFLKQDRTRKEAFVGVEQAPLKSVVVLSAVYTKKVKHDYNNNHNHPIESLLGDMAVPHTVVNREDFGKYDLSQAGVLLINCAQYRENCICPDCKPSGATNNRLRTCSNCDRHIKFKAELTGDEVKKIADFVHKGGYLFAEDWVIGEILAKAFPKTVAAEKKLGEAAVDVMPARGLGTHPYLKGIFEPRFIEPPAGFDDEVAEGEKKKEPRTIVVKKKGEEAEPEISLPGSPLTVKHKWQIDDESYSIRILDKERVVTLLTSGKLAGAAGGDGAVAVTFRPGSNAPIGQKAAKGQPGVVLAVLSHFGKQESAEDEMAIQNLLLNFLIDANAAREERAPRRKAAKESKEPKEKAPEETGEKTAGDAGGKPAG